ncbi:hypothetical protein J8J27_26640, partial [Mycobacterium tuberculosis]|nr:hypothetical protein [Mycobacterium tuberculosis]
PYNFDYPPEIDPHWRDQPVSAADHREKAIRAFSDLVASLNKGRPLPLYFTEFGWSTASTGLTQVDETTQADYLARGFLIFLDARLGGVPLKS